jgi:CheY-like chemotaxis protein
VNSELHFLIVDDDIDKRYLVSYSVARAFPRASLYECSSGQEAIDFLKAQRVDALITDHSMAPVNGIELIRHVRSRDKALPILMVTGHPEIRDEALAAGATSVIEWSGYTDVGKLLKPLLR